MTWSASEGIILKSSSQHKKVKYLFIHLYILTHYLSNLFQPYKGERPPTPRQLKDVLTSTSRSNEFHAYLADMDKTHEEYTKQTYLNFALKCNELRKAANSKEAEKILTFMSAEFFSNPTR